MIAKRVMDMSGIIWEIFGSMGPLRIVRNSLENWSANDNVSATIYQSFRYRGGYMV